GAMVRYGLLPTKGLSQGWQCHVEQRLEAITWRLAVVSQRRQLPDRRLLGVHAAAAIHSEAVRLLGPQTRFRGRSVGLARNRVRRGPDASAGARTSCPSGRDLVESSGPR